MFTTKIRRCPRCRRPMSRNNCRNCNRAVQADLDRAAARGIDAAPHPCSQMCGKKVCGRTVRGGVCPCPYC